jgi:hypothetical protein
MILLLASQVCQVVAGADVKGPRRKIKHIVGLTIKEGRKREVEVLADTPLEFPSEEQLDEVLPLP